MQEHDEHFSLDTYTSHEPSVPMPFHGSGADGMPQVLIWFTSQQQVQSVLYEFSTDIV